MNKLLIALSLLVAGSLVALALALRPQPNQTMLPLGSVNVANEYNATTTRSNATATIADLAVISSTSGTLGSVVVTGVGTGDFYLYDATSTITNTEWATSTLAHIGPSLAAGTYTFDVVFHKGLLIDTNGTVGSSTITWRAR